MHPRISSVITIEPLAPISAALASLCREVERAVRQHQSAGVRAVILMVDQPSSRPEPAVAPVPVYVDVFDSGFSQDSGYGYGV